jgi:hypothetical protein
LLAVGSNTAPGQAVVLPLTVTPSPTIFQFAPSVAAASTGSGSNFRVIIRIYLNRPGFAQFRLATVVNSVTQDVHYNYCYILDPRLPCERTITQKCNTSGSSTGTIDDSLDYVLFYRAIDNYGNYAQLFGGTSTTVSPKYYVVNVG